MTSTVQCMRKANAPRRWLQRGLVLALVASCVLPALAQARVRAWLDRDRIELGESATLNIQTDQLSGATPDYRPLMPRFALSGHTSTRRYEQVNGNNSASTLYAVALRPAREGVFQVPALQVGGERTQPLTLTVVAATAMPARAGEGVFVEARTDTQDPYVQQAIGYVVRLYYAMPLISGRLVADPPEGASMQQVGDDLKYTRQIAGRDYTVLERRYLIVPERSGTLQVPAVRFDGEAVGGFLDDFFGDGRRELHARGAPVALRVRPMPANAPQPWLPLRSLTLQTLDAPSSARVGEAATVTVEALADGATGTQMPELALQAPDGAQVFADPPQIDERFDQGRPVVRVTRKFSVVPARAGPLHLPGPHLSWWDVRAGVARIASVPDISLQVAPGAAGSGMQNAVHAPATGESAQGWVRVPFVQGAVRPWALAAVGFAFLWLATLWWGLHCKTSAAPASASGNATPSSSSPDRAAARAKGSTGDDLRRALEDGDLGDVADALIASAGAGATDLDDVRARLDDSAQRDAVDALQRARWGDGDAAAARAELRAAFKAGARWRAQAGTAEPLLPPLYPDRSPR